MVIVPTIGAVENEPLASSRSRQGRSIAVEGRPIGATSEWGELSTMFVVHCQLGRISDYQSDIVRFFISVQLCDVDGQAQADTIFHLRNDRSWKRPARTHISCS
jgi:hypothetical protein